MSVFYSFVRCLLFLTILLGLVTLAIPLLMLGMYVDFMKDCYRAGQTAYAMLKKHLM